jgi:hypothetical protein
MRTDMAEDIFFALVHERCCDQYALSVPDKTFGKSNAAILGRTFQ